MSQQINLFNPVFLKQKKQFSALTLAQGLCMILLGSIAVAVFAKLQAESLRLRQKEINAQINVTQAQLAKVMAEYPPRQKNPALEAEEAKADAELRGLQQMLDIVQRGGMGNDQGYAAYFTAFSRQIVSDLWLTGFRIAGPGSEIELRGRALRPELVPVYLNRLRQEPVLRGKTFATLAMSAPPAPASGTGAPTGNNAPVTDTPAKPAAPAAAKTGQPAPYVEFTLRSAGFSREGAAESPDKNARAADLGGLPASLHDALGVKKP